jgi:molybdopterin-binding protein
MYVGGNGGRGGGVITTVSFLIGSGSEITGYPTNQALRHIQLQPVLTALAVPSSVSVDCFCVQHAIALLSITLIKGTVADLP